MASPVGQVRAAGAAGSHKAPAAAVRGRLVELVKDDNQQVHTAAIEALDAVAPNDAEGFALALGSIFYGLQVRAGEMGATRRAEPHASGGAGRNGKLERDARPESHLRKLSRGRSTRQFVTARPDSPHTGRASR